MSIFLMVVSASVIAYNIGKAVERVRFLQKQKRKNSGTIDYLK